WSRMRLLRLVGVGPVISGGARKMHQAEFIADAVKRFGMADEEIATGHQPIVKVVDGAALGSAIEVDENVVSNDRLHTCSIMWVRVTCLPALRIRYSSSENSFGVRSSVRPALLALCSTRFNSRSSMRSTVSGNRAPRRSNARTRADNSERANGLI